MKIAFVRTASNILKFGSYNIQEIGLARSLLKYGVSTDVYARFSNVEEVTEIYKENGAMIRICPLRGRRVFKEIMYYPTLKKELCNGDYDIVQLLDDSQMMLPFLFRALKRKGVKTILWQGMYRDFSGKIALLMQKTYDFFLSKTLNKYSDIKIAKTDYAKQYLVEKNYQNVVTLPVGLDYVEYSLNEDLDKTIKIFKEKFPYILLYIGTIEPRRNIDFILDLLNEIKRDDVGLILVGNGPDYGKIRDRIKVLNLSNNILQFKNIPNNQIVSVFVNSNIFLLPTNYEIYGMVVMEALYFGIPVISTPEAGPKSILKNEILGTCISLERKEWIKAVDYYLNKERTEEDVALRKKEIEQNFRWESIGDKYYKIIQNL